MNIEFEILIAKTIEDCKLISNIAKEIWVEHYTPIIGKEQVNYMIDNFQSATKILHDINNGLNYFTLKCYGKIAGYVGYRIEEDEKNIFLSKLYIYKDFRGKGLSKKIIQYLLNISNQIDHIWLTVNKYNTNSISAYKKLGFTITEDVISDIGNGFVMDDYIMKLNK